MINAIKKYFKNRSEKIFWNKPDSWLSSVDLDGDQSFAKIKNNLALLENIPNPSTGYRYKDIVEVIGPVGKKMFRDEEIDVYKATSLYKKSNSITISFEAILPKSNDYFLLINEFRSINRKVQFPWSPDDNSEWRQGFCTAENLETAKKILESFIEKEFGRKVRNIIVCAV